MQETNLRPIVVAVLAMVATLKEKEINHGAVTLNLTGEREIKAELKEKVMAIGAMEEIGGLFIRAGKVHDIKLEGMALDFSSRGYYSKTVARIISTWIFSGAAWDEHKIIFLTESGMKTSKDLVKEGLETDSEMTKRLASIFEIEKSEAGRRIFKEAEEEVKKATENKKEGA